MVQKENIFQRITVILFAMALCLLPGCSGDNVLLPEPPQNDNKNATALQFTVGIADDAPTRALTEKASFSDGEEIGIYIYKKDGSLLKENLKATVASGGNSLTFTAGAPVITEDVDIKAYYPFRSNNDYTTVPTSGYLPYIANANATILNANVTLKFTKNIAKLEITLIACPDFKNAGKYGTVFGMAVGSDEITEYSRNKGGWCVYTVTKYLQAANRNSAIYENGAYKAPVKDKTFEAGKIYKYNYNFLTKEENSNLITSIEDFQKIEKGKKYSQINDLTSPDGKLWQANVELEKGRTMATDF